MKDLNMSIELWSVSPDVVNTLDKHWPEWRRHLNFTIHTYELVISGSERNFVFSDVDILDVHKRSLRTHLGQHMAESKSAKITMWVDEDDNQ